MLKDKRPEKVCIHQIVCVDKEKEETPKDRYHCQSRLLECHNCTCPYNLSHISATSYLDGKEERHFHFKIQTPGPHTGGDGVCQDFRILPKVRKSLISKVVKELNESK